MGVDLYALGSLRNIYVVGPDKLYLGPLRYCRPIAYCLVPFALILYIGDWVDSGFVI